MSRANRPPNVVLILSDQHRHDLMTCAGRDLVPTPNLDRLAAEGVRFTRAYCPYPSCVASRMSLLTGLYPHHTGAVTNRDRLDWRFRTVAHAFADHGYLTGLIGKMHFNDAHKHGFEYYLSVNDWLMYLGPKVRHYAWEIANHAIGPHFFDTLVDDGSGFPDIAEVWDGPSPWVGQVERNDFSSVASRLAAEDHLDSFVARESIRFMARYREQPFFLVVGFMKPHPPLYPPAEYAARHPVDQIELPDPGDPSGYPEHLQRRIRTFQNLGEHRLRAHRAGYLGNLAFVDTRIGQVLGALIELDLADDTLVVYTSDHGELDGDHGLFQKFCLFEPAVRVPLIARWPGRIPAGRTCDALTEYLGLYPTLMELAGLELPSGTAVADLPDAPAAIDGRSFAALLRNPSSPGPEAVFAENEVRGANGQYMVRTDRWKYLLNQAGTDELYDHTTDPGELANRAADPACRAVIEELRARLLAWYDPARRNVRPSPG